MFPFDIKLGFKEDYFVSEYKSLLKNVQSPARNVSLFKTEEGKVSYNKSIGWINDQRTFFVFSLARMVAAIVPITMDPAKEPDMYSAFDARAKRYIGSRDNQSSVSYWVINPGTNQEILAISHGSSSGVNELILF